jgi:pimeloyl-ACP methyl ester carboxylesterase
MPGEWEGTNPYSLEGHSNLTVALMDRLGIQKAILVGHSVGGTVSVLTAIQHPERVQALVLVDPAIYPGGETPDWLRYLSFLPQVNRLGPLLVRSIASEGLTTLNTAWHDPSKITPEITAGYMKPLRAENWDYALWEYTVAHHPLGLEKQLNQLNVPVLVITGDDDRLVPVNQSIRLASEISGAQLSIVPNCGHVPHEECPDAFMQAVVAFLMSNHFYG